MVRVYRTIIMTYEEKRELRLQISQLLADAGLNQGRIKEIVNEEIKNKVERAVDQAMNNLNAQCSSGNYLEDRVKSYLSSANTNYYINQMVKEEIKNRVIQIVFKDIEVIK